MTGTTIPPTTPEGRSDDDHCPTESVARPADAPAEPARFGPVHLDVIDPNSEHRDDGVLVHDPAGNALLLTASYAPAATDSNPPMATRTRTDHGRA